MLGAEKRVRQCEQLGLLSLHNTCLKPPVSYLLEPDWKPTHKEMFEAAIDRGEFPEAMVWLPSLDPASNDVVCFDGMLAREAQAALFMHHVFQPAAATQEDLRRFIGVILEFLDINPTLDRLLFPCWDEVQDPPAESPFRSAKAHGRGSDHQR